MIRVDCFSGARDFIGGGLYGWTLTEITAAQETGLCVVGCVICYRDVILQYSVNWETFVPLGFYVVRYCLPHKISKELN